MIDTIYAQIASDHRQELLTAARERRLARRARATRPAGAGCAVAPVPLARPATSPALTG